MSRFGVGKCAEGLRQSTSWARISHGIARLPPAFAARSGQEPREFRLRLGNALRDYEDFIAEQYGRVIRSALDVGDRKLATDLAEAIAPGRGVDWVLRFARANPNEVVARPATHVRLAVQASDHPDRVFLEAGFNALDSGRDVRMIDGSGIRLKDAVFDPGKARSRSISASLFGLPTAGILTALPERE